MNVWKQFAYITECMIKKATYIESSYNRRHIHIVSRLFSWIYVDSQMKVNIWSRNKVFFMLKKLKRVSQSFDKRVWERIETAHHKASIESLHYYSGKTKIEIRSYLKICLPHQILGTNLSRLECANGKHKLKHEHKRQKAQQNCSSMEIIPSMFLLGPSSKRWGNIA